MNYTNIEMCFEPCQVTEGGGEHIHVWMYPTVAGGSLSRLSRLHRYPRRYSETINLPVFSITFNSIPFREIYLQGSHVYTDISRDLIADE